MPNPNPMSERFASQRLMERLDHDVELAGEIVSVFLEDSPATLARLDNACKDANIAEIRLATHKLKGALLNVNAISAVESVALLEAAALTGDSTLVNEPLCNVKAEIAALTATLKSFIEEDHESSHC